MYSFDPKKTDNAVVSMLELAVPQWKRSAKPNLVFRQVAGATPLFRIKPAKTQTVVEYTTPNAASRAAGSLLAGLSCEEKSPLSTLGIMLDCSRGKVMKPEKVKDWLRKLALMGYNLVMLYTEDTYQLSGYPYLGFMRGGYSLAELRDMDDYAAKLGIELVGCIQTLGHMEQALRWSANGFMRDTAGVLLVENKPTYDFLDAAIAFWSEALRSRRINIGMDETHDLGLGNYLNRNGYKNQAELFNAHLAQVNKLCRRHKLTAMMWSDMFFRLSTPTRNYYDLSHPVPQSVKDTIPKDVQLGYWDYYHEDEAFYLKHIAAHRALGFEPVMVSGIWTWAKSWCDMQRSERTVIPCLKACRKAKLKEVIFTMWGDDGAYCLFDSAMPYMAVAADAAFGDFDAKHAAAKKRFAALTGCSFDDYSIPARLEQCYETTDGAVYPPSPVTFVWDDILNGIAVAAGSAGKVPALPFLKKTYASVARKLRARERKGADSALLTMEALAEAALAKINLREALEAAYDAKDRTVLKKLARKTIPETISLLENWLALYRVEWLSCCRPNGLDMIENRTNASIGRLKEAQTCIFEYLDGREDALSLLDCRIRHKDSFGTYWYAAYATCGKQ